MAARLAIRKHSLLCVDDDAQCLAVRRLLFEAFGFEVESCTSPRQGLRLHQTRRFDAAVIDYQMPEMDGGELARQMKGLRADVPVVILSGLAGLPDGTPEFYDSFVSKGDSGFKLVKEVQSLIDNSTDGSSGTHGSPKTPRAPKRLFTAAGIAMGVAAEGLSDLWSHVRRHAPDAADDMRQMKRVLAARA